MPGPSGPRDGLGWVPLTRPVDWKGEGWSIECLDGSQHKCSKRTRNCYGSRLFGTCQGAGTRFRYFSYFFFLPEKFARSGPGCLSCTKHP